MIQNAWHHRDFHPARPHNRFITLAEALVRGRGCLNPEFWPSAPLLVLFIDFGHWWGPIELGWLCTAGSRQWRIHPLHRGNGMGKGTFCLQPGCFPTLPSHLPGLVLENSQIKKQASRGLLVKDSQSQVSLHFTEFSLVSALKDSLVLLFSISKFCNVACLSQKTNTFVKCNTIEFLLEMWLAGVSEDQRSWNSYEREQKGNHY